MGAFKNYPAAQASLTHPPPFPGLIQLARAGTWPQEPKSFPTDYTF